MTDIVIFILVIATFAAVATIAELLGQGGKLAMLISSVLLIIAALLVAYLLVSLFDPERFA